VIEEDIFSFDPDLKLFKELLLFETEIKRLKEMKILNEKEKKILKQYKYIYQHIQEILSLKLPINEEDLLEESDSSEADGTLSHRNSLDIREKEKKELEEVIEKKRDSEEKKEISRNSKEILRNSKEIAKEIEIKRTSKELLPRDSTDRRDSRDSLDKQEELKEYQIFKEGIEKFSNSFKEGIQFLSSQKILDSPKSIARFLIKTGDLDKMQFGLLMGNPKQTEISNFVAEFMIFNPFHSLDFEESLRNFLKLFILPSEGQQVARISDIFSDNFIKLKPLGLEDPENAVLLTAGILMLNVSLHNPKIKSKDRLNKGQFLRLLDSTKFKKEYLSQLYDNIKNNEIKYNISTYEKKQSSLFKNILKKKDSNSFSCKSCISFKEYIQFSDGSLSLMEYKELCIKHLKELIHDDYIVLYSSSDSSSFDQSIQFINQIKKRKDSKVILVSNQKLEEKRLISLHKGLQLAMDLNVPYIETSLSFNIEFLFQFVLDSKYSLLEFSTDEIIEEPKIYF